MHSSNPSTGLFLMKLIFQINEFPRVWMSCIYSYSYFRATEHVSCIQAHYTIFGACLFCQNVERRTRYRRRRFCVSSAACQASHYLLLHPVTLILELEQQQEESLRFKTNLPHFPRLAYEPPIVQLQWSAREGFAQSLHILPQLYCISKKGAITKQTFHLRQL